MRPDRHHFVRLDPASAGDWRYQLDCHGDGRGQIKEWVEAGKPLVVGSSWGDDPAGLVRVGLATPMKQRFSALVPVSAIREAAPPPALCDAALCAPLTWRGMIGQVVSLAASGGIECRVFGSLAWQHLTSERFVRETSDIDLLLRFGDGCNALTVIDQIFAQPDEARIDGELVLADGSGVNLRELRARPAQVLAKRHGGPRLITLNEALELGSSAA